ncbi:UDP-glucose 4-epimerase [Salmonella enterica subsp. enterica serovar Choleraesuis]|nr:UDP-glucose 4-epimerase [Salmonella enterica subsp. enterica serovar Choleraesuis]
MAVLVTGGAGYIGSHTLILLLQNGYEVVVVDNLSNSSYESLNRVQAISGVEVKFYQGDILDASLMRDVFENNHIESIIHFAGLKSVGESNLKPLDYYEVNVYGTIRLLQLSQEYHVKRFIFSSSATVYGNPLNLPIQEHSPIGNTTNPYGTSKLMSEKILEDFTKTHKDLQIVILRYFNPVGAHPSGLIGESPHGVPNNLVPFVSQVAAGKIGQVNIYGADYPTPDGTGVRDYIHVMDLARGHINALESNLLSKPIDILNLGTGNGYSVLEVIKVFERISGNRIKYIIRERRNGDVASCWADCQKAKDLLGWQADYSLDEMIAHTWNWQSKNPNGYEIE